MDVHKIIDKEHVKKYFRTHVMPDKFRKKVPDGIYDLQEGECKWRDIIINGCVMYTISKMWLDKGGPVDLPEEFRYPWGTYLK